jgi:hypothetical protein
LKIVIAISGEYAYITATLFDIVNSKIPLAACGVVISASRA